MQDRERLHPPLFAHSLEDRPEKDWEPLDRHLADVADLASRYAGAFGWQGLARVAGLLHDVGKASGEFQAHIRRPRTATPTRGPDHSTAGAQHAKRLYPRPAATLLAQVIAGHHAGLSDRENLQARFAKTVAPVASQIFDTLELPSFKAVGPDRALRPSAQSGFSPFLLTRMVFSALVDADRTATAAFYGAPPEPAFTPLPILRDRLVAYMAELNPPVAAGVGAARAKVLAAAKSKADLAPGLFTMTVPTGGGKTLASLSFALDHACRHGLRRVLYVIPFTSIIEQTAAVFRQALGTEEDVLEHHASFDWGEDGEEGDALLKLRRAVENWSAPIIVTTAVQFFESLYAHRPGPCRKLHNLAGAVIVLDEAQTLPLHLLRPCMAVLDELARNYGCTVVLCTATQPALRGQDGFNGGLIIPDERELAPDPPCLYERLRRVKVEVLPDPVPDAALAEQFSTTPQMLCVVNTRAHAAQLYGALQGLEGAVHLSTLMCARHRRVVLMAVRARLVAGLPVRLVSTSLIEAGVDISFPEVWRAWTGLDSIAQAAGRCNRNGELPEGRVVVFTPAEVAPPRSMDPLIRACQSALRKHPDLLGLNAVRAYFQTLYWHRDEAGALDAAEVNGRPGIMRAIAEEARDCNFPFEGISRAFRMIEEEASPLVVPWDAEAEELLRRLAAMGQPAMRDLRRLQQYTVGVPRRVRDRWLALGVLGPVNPVLGDGLLAFPDLAHYDAATGVRLDGLEGRNPASNVF